MRDQRRARAAYARLSRRAKRLMTEAGLKIMRGGPRSTELSNLSELVERDSHGKTVRHTRVDPAKVEEAEELVKSGLAYVPAQADKDKSSYVALTSLGEAAAVLAAKSARGPRVEAEARKYSTLDEVSTHLSGALHYLEDGTRTDRFQHFGPEERRRLSELIIEAGALQAKVNAFRDRLGPNPGVPKDIRPPPNRPAKSRRVTRPGRS